MPRTEANDSSEQKLLDDVRQYGWHCINVFGDETHESFSYTIGLLHSYAHPELLIYGMKPEMAHAVLSIVAEAAASGAPLNFEEPTAELLEGYSCVFVPVPANEYPAHVGFAQWFYEGETFSVQQIVWPSKPGVFPWHPDASSEFRSKQPVLGQRGLCG